MTNPKKSQLLKISTNLKISKSQNHKITKSQNHKISKSQSYKSQNLKIYKSQNLKLNFKLNQTELNWAVTQLKSKVVLIKFGSNFF